MQGQDYEQLTLFQVDSHASPSPLPGSSEARRMTVISGRKCSESYGNSGPLGSLVRMCLRSSIWHSTRCFLTWKVKGTKYNASLFRLAVSMPRTKENGSPFWPTPSTGAALCAGTGNFKTLQAMCKRGLITEEERRQLSQGNGGKTNPELLEWLMGYERKFTEELVPTPTATDYKGGCSTRYWRPYSWNVHVEREREREREREPRVRRPAEIVSGTHSAWEDWPDEPGIPRVLDGVPNRVDRIKCLGNAVVPQQFYPFFRAIYLIETGDIREYLY